MTTATHAAQRAMRNGTKRAVDGIAAVRSAGIVNIATQPRAYCMSDADAAAALARRKEPPPPKEAPSYAEAHLIDRMWQRGQFNDRLHDTAVRLYSLFVMAGLEPRVCVELGERSGAAPEMDEGVSLARTAFNRALSATGQKNQDLLHAMCLGHHPGINWLASLQSGLLEIEKPLAVALKKMREERTSG